MDAPSKNAGNKSRFEEVKAAPVMYQHHAAAASSSSSDDSEEESEDADNDDDQLVRRAGQEVNGRDHLDEGMLEDEDDEDDEEDEDDDDDDLEDEEDDDDEDSSSGKMLQRKHKNRNNYNFEYNGEILRGSRTNCKGHWSKEEVSTHLAFRRLSSSFIFFLLSSALIILFNVAYLNLISSPKFLSRISISLTLSENMEVKIGRESRRSSRGGRTCSACTVGRRSSIPALSRARGPRRRTGWSYISSTKMGLRNGL